MTNPVPPADKSHIAPTLVDRHFDCIPNCQRTVTPCKGACSLKAEQVSDTPRTDALEVLDSPERHKALWDLCATLERELAGVRKENELVEAENDKLRASARSAGGTNLPDAGPSPRADAFYAVRDGRIHRPGITAEQGYEFARGLDRMLLQLEKAAFARSAIPTSSEDKSPSSANTATVKEVRNEMAEFYASDALNTDERTVGNQLDCKVAEKLSRWIGMLR